MVVTPTRKRPLFAWKEYQNRRATPVEVRRWWHLYRQPGFAIVTGSISDLIVLDFDGEAGEALREQLGLRASVHTPSGGSHVHVAQPEFTIKSVARPDPTRFPGLDVKAEGGVATFYGQTARGEYRCPEARHIYTLAELPESLRELLDGLRRDNVLTVASFELPATFDGFCARP